MTQLRGIWRLPVAGVLVVAACGQEQPTQVGGGLVPTGVQTFEVVLDTPVFLEDDTVLPGLARRSEALFYIVARNYGGVLNSHTLVGYAPPPTTVTFLDADSVEHTEEDPVFVGGELVMWVDTAASRMPAPAVVRVFPLTEEWDAATASWEFRIDSAGVREPWSVPGGPAAGVSGVGTLEAESDTISIPLDSQFVALFLGQDENARGTLITTDTEGGRLRGLGMELSLHIRPAAAPDTILSRVVSRTRRTFLSDPPAPARDADELRLGGLPVSRAVLHLREGLDTLRISACAGVPRETAPAECLVALKDVTINRAAIRFHLMDVPVAYQPEDTVWMDARRLLVQPDIPLARSPLGDRLNRLRAPVPPERFAAPQPDRTVELHLTELITRLATPAEDDDSPETRPRVLAVMASPEGTTLGHVSLGGLAAGERAPRLRLIVTHGTETDR